MAAGLFHPGQTGQMKLEPGLTRLWWMYIHLLPQQTKNPPQTSIGCVFEARVINIYFIQTTALELTAQAKQRLELLVGWVEMPVLRVNASKIRKLRNRNSSFPASLLTF